MIPDSAVMYCPKMQSAVDKNSNQNLNGQPGSYKAHNVGSKANIKKGLQLFFSSIYK